MSRRPDRFTPDRIDTFWRREAARRSGFSGKTLGLVLALGMMIGWQAPDWWARLAPEIAMPTASTGTAPSSASADQLSADFGYCHSGGGTNCVVDGDTFWFRGEKYRIADIDTPETHGPRCSEEGALGARATSRLQQLHRLTYVFSPSHFRDMGMDIKHNTPFPTGQSSFQMGIISWSTL